MPSIPAISSIVWPSMAASKRTRRNFSGNSARALSRCACNSLEAARSSAVLVGGWCSGCDQTVSRRSRRFPERKRSSAKRNAIRTSHARNRVRSRKRSNRRFAQSKSSRSDSQPPEQFFQVGFIDDHFTGWLARRRSLDGSLIESLKESHFGDGVFLAA